jgi:hypothetical protein
VNGVDGLVEHLGRRLASRTSRRGFLAQAGRVAVVVAGGSTIALALESPAIARVCGQSGVSPKCANYDCHDTWGWCWYAKGCCAGGLLKKICDCCAPNTPNPVGYCPSGTRVKCIVESCGADPRLQTRIIRRLRSHDAVELALTVSRTRFPQTGRPIAILGWSGNPGAMVAAASLQRVADAPVLLTELTGLDARVSEEMDRLGTEFVIVVGGGFSAPVLAALAAQGRTVHQIAAGPQVEDVAAQAATWSRARSGARTAIAVMPGVAFQAAGAAAALAAAKGWPLVFGDGPGSQAALREPEPVQRTLVVTDDAAHAGRFPGGQPIAATSAAALSVALADRMAGEGVSGDTVVLTPVEHAGTQAALAALGAPMLTYRRGTLDGAWNWLHAHRAGVQRAFVAGLPDEFDDKPYYDLQSLLNEFEAHLLIGQAGQGLPVISQPRAERPIGKARR